MDWKELRNHKGIVSLSTESVAKLLNIDPEYKFVHGYYDFDSNSFRFGYVHPSFPITKDGDAAPQVFINKDTKVLEYGKRD